MGKDDHTPHLVTRLRITGAVYPTPDMSLYTGRNLLLYYMLNTNFMALMQVSYTRDGI